MHHKSLVITLPTTPCTELVESDKEHEDLNRLLDYLQDKIRAAWPSSVLSKHSKKELLISSEKHYGCFCIQPIHAAPFILDLKRSILNTQVKKTNAKRCIVGAQTVWASLLFWFMQVEQHKGLGEGDYRSGGVDYSQSVT